MDNNVKFPVQLTYAAAEKIKFFVKKNIKSENLKLRVYITGGGCGGFQYGFVLDNQVFENDYVIENNGANLIVDHMSLQYLFGGIVDYYEGLEGAKFVVVNPNAKTICSCGSSFSM